jgi:hypothetical protein
MISQDAKATLLVVAGLAALGFGALIALQGAGIVHWPPQSDMIGHRDWIERGIVVVLIGLAMIVTAWRIRKS